MAEGSDFYAGEVSKFNDISDKIFRSVYNEREEYKLELNRMLDIANSLEYSLKFVAEESAGKLLEQCCYLVPLHWEHSVVKLCLLVSNLINKQQIILKSNLAPVCEYFMRALRQCKPWMYTDVLRALAIIFYENGGHLSKYEEELVRGDTGRLLQLCLAQDEDVARAAVQCIENISIKTNLDLPYLSEESQVSCFTCLLSLLQKPRPTSMDLASYIKLLQSEFRAMQNILLGSKCLPVADKLGALLAAIKVFMFSGLPGFPNTVPTSLNPTPLSQYDHPITKSLPAPSTPVSKPAAAGKKTRKRKGKDKKQEKDTVDEDRVAGEMEQLSVTNESLGAGCSNKEPSSSFLLSLSRMSSSESEYSDTEGGQANKLRSLHSRLRHCTLSCFVALVKIVDRRLMFGYWNSFIPDVPGIGGPPSSHTLFTAIMKDSSPKVRTVSVAVLSGMLEGSKQLLHAAEESDQYRNAPFTPFSVTLGYMVKEIHRCLLLALVAETSPQTVLQIIKCLAVLITNVPYHRLKPGLLSRVVKQIKPFMTHRDPNIRVACLTCLGSVASTQAAMLEVTHIFLSSRSHPNQNSESQSHSDPPRTSVDMLRDSGYTTGSQSSPGTATPPTPSSGLMTPPTPVGTPSSDPERSWVVRFCVKNLASHLLDSERSKVGKSGTRGRTDDLQPLPIRLESLQLLAQIAKGYFPVLKGWLVMIGELLQLCLRDQEPSVQLHGAKLLEQMSSSFIHPRHSDQAADSADMDETSVTMTMEANQPDDHSVEQMLHLWLPLLKDSIPGVVQSTKYSAVKYTLCDCLANVGPHVFNSMPMGQRMLCITLLLGMTGDEDHHVRASAVRALGVYVLYPCLREDVSFVADSANMIINGLSESNLLVRVKSAWALGNLTDALVLNRTENDTCFLEEFSDILLLKLFEAATRAGGDSDKVRWNAVRALGNLMLYLPEQTPQKKVRFDKVVESTILALMKNITSGGMKVRWNACHAVGKVFKNPHLSLTTTQCMPQLYSALTAVIRDCKNFKVRINAAMALALPTDRCLYGNTGVIAEIWKSLVVALDVANAVTELTEFRHRDTLTEQVCCTMVHLLCVMESVDLGALHRLIMEKREVISQHMNKYLLLLSQKPAQHQDRVTELSRALDHLQQLLPGEVNEKELVSTCISLLTLTEEELDEEAGTEAEAASPLTGFVQTYD